MEPNYAKNADDSAKAAYGTLEVDQLQAKLSGELSNSHRRIIIGLIAEKKKQSADEDRRYSRKSYLISVISVFIALISLVISILALKFQAVQQKSDDHRAKESIRSSRKTHPRGNGHASPNSQSGPPKHEQTNTKVTEPKGSLPSGPQRSPESHSSSDLQALPKAGETATPKAESAKPPIQPQQK